MTTEDLLAKELDDLITTGDPRLKENGVTGAMQQAFISHLSWIHSHSYTEWLEELQKHRSPEDFFDFDGTEATRLDPNSALAFAALAESYASLNYLGGAMPHEAMPKARAAAERALALDPDLSEAHSALGEILHRYAWDWRGAERELKRALELNPSDSCAHWLYGYYLLVMGHMDEAVSEAKRART